MFRKTPLPDLNSIGGKGTAQGVVILDTKEEVEAN